MINDKSIFIGTQPMTHSGGTLRKIIDWASWISILTSHLAAPPDWFPKESFSSSPSPNIVHIQNGGRGVNQRKEICSSSLSKMAFYKYDGMELGWNEVWILNQTGLTRNHNLTRKILSLTHHSYLGLFNLFELKITEIKRNALFKWSDLNHAGGPL